MYPLLILAMFMSLMTGMIYSNSPAQYTNYINESKAQASQMSYVHGQSLANCNYQSQCNIQALATSNYLKNINSQFSEKDFTNIYYNGNLFTAYTGPISEYGGLSSSLASLGLPNTKYYVYNTISSSVGTYSLPQGINGLTFNNSQPFLVTPIPSIIIPQFNGVVLNTTIGGVNSNNVASVNDVAASVGTAGALNLTPVTPTFVASTKSTTPITGSPGSSNVAANYGVPSSGTGCIVSLNSSNTNAISIDNEGNVNASKCGIFAYSNAADAINLSNANVVAAGIYAVGGIYKDGGSITVKNNCGSGAYGGCNGNSNINATLQVNSSLPDLKTIATTLEKGLPSTINADTAVNQTCTYNNLNLYWGESGFCNGGTCTLPAGVYCGGLNIGNGLQVNLAVNKSGSNVFYIQNGNFTIGGGATVYGAAGGQTFVLSGSKAGTINWGNGANSISLSAPSTGTYAGILVYQNTDAGNNVEDSFNGGGHFNINGLIDVPSANFNVNNDCTLQGNTAGSLSVIANTVEVTGSAKLNL